MKRILVCIAVLAILCSWALAAKAASSNGNSKDGSVMITIPAGKFTMGSDVRDIGGGSDEQPAHTVYLDAYQIGKCEVTVAQYRKFCIATARKMPSAPKWGWKNDHPMVSVSWYDALAYCKWAGGRLPTEAEWEKAARGTGGRTFPWGDTWDRNKCANQKLNLTSTVSVGSYPTGASPYGCMDMTGNVWEWCADWYDRGYYATSSSENPKGPSRGSFRVMRGGGWGDAVGDYARCAYRGYGVTDYPSSSSCYLGFRLVRSSGGLGTKTASSKAGSKSVGKALATKPNARDGSVMITIPAGKFTMGSNGDEPDEKPAHVVHIDAYQIGMCEVTVAQYRKFCNATGNNMPDAPAWGWQDNHPIVNVSWFDAEAYCKWAGGRLPTEAEWEKAARGTDRRKYPWGDRSDDSKFACSRLTSTVSVGRYPAGASPYGCMDMAGNVSEWCADWHDLDYYKTSPSRNPVGPQNGKYRAVRGGGWSQGEGMDWQCTDRLGSLPVEGCDTRGFRLAR